MLTSASESRTPRQVDEQAEGKNSRPTEPAGPRNENLQSHSHSRQTINLHSLDSRVPPMISKRCGRSKFTYNTEDNSKHLHFLPDENQDLDLPQVSIKKFSTYSRSHGLNKRTPDKPIRYKQMKCSRNGGKGEGDLSFKYASRIVYPQSGAGLRLKHIDNAILVL